MDARFPLKMNLLEGTLLMLGNGGIAIAIALEMLIENDHR